MTVSTTSNAPVELDVDLLLLPVTEDQATSGFEALSEFGPSLERAARDFNGAVGDVRVVYAGPPTATRLALVGMGAEDDLDPEAVRQALAAASAAARDHEADSVACLSLHAGPLDDSKEAQALVEGFLLGAYEYRRYKTDDAFAAPSSFVVHVGQEQDEEDIRAATARGQALAEATGTARDLVNRSPNDKTAEAFADLVSASGTSHGYAVETWDEDRIRAEGMGGLLAVNQGSFDPPTFSILRWQPDDAVNEKPIVVVGKGVMFDTGGLSLKDTKGSMDKMKSDMGGAAAVVGLFEALAGLNVSLDVIGLIPATDNRPGRKAYVPGDVIKMHSGATVEVMNTDAEGRLLLADALSYASSTYDPALVIDLATLTGSCIAALGSKAAGVMASETDAAAERLYALQRAGERTGERVHPLPMYAEYKELLDSNTADLKNVGGPSAGAITAGKFLEHFVEAPWLHLDIAGPAFLDEPSGYAPTGGTGFGVRLLADYLESYTMAHSSA